MIRDFNVEHLEKRILLPWNTFTGVHRIVDNAANDNFRSATSATSATAVIASSLVAGLTTSADNDGLSGYFMFDDLDITKQMRFRVHFQMTADSGGVTWDLQYLPIIAGTTVIAAPSTALSTVIPVYSTALSTDNVWRVTDFGRINRNTILDTTDAFIFAVTVTDSSPLTGLQFLALEVRYTPRRMAGPRRNILGGRRLVTTRPLGVQLHATQEGL